MLGLPVVDHDIPGHGDVFSDGHIVRLVDCDFNGHLNCRVRGGRRGCTPAGGVTTAAVKLSLTAALGLVAVAGARLLRRCAYSSLVHHSLLDGPPCRFGRSLGLPGRLWCRYLGLDHLRLRHFSLL